MARQPSGCPVGGHLNGQAELNDEQLEKRLVWLCSEIQGRVNVLHNVLYHNPP